ncbi:MAG: endolytic transglycosylase MltG [Treponema sp.]|nr:endolytic transglycosylase MltG [Treponema sp.]
MRREHKTPKGLRLLFGLLSSLIAAFLILAAILVGTAIYLNKAPEPRSGVSAAGITLDGEGNALITIGEGESSYAVGRRLEQAGLIRTRHFWNLLSRFEKDFIKAGTYRIPLPASQTGIRGALVEGRQILLRVTIPEGVTLKKAAAIMETAGICSAGDFLSAARDGRIIESYQIPNATMEGYLYPETYFFPAAYPAERVIRAMADTFMSRVKEIAPESAGMSAGELNNIIILASIVEREYRVADEAPIMAGVFYNRLRINMPLQSCATVEYLITEIQEKPHPYQLFNIDIEQIHPFNTYVNGGLPPGPISFPGRTALDAAFHPAQTDYLYFRLVDEAAGRHYFSKSLDAHIKAGALFVKG